MSKFYKVNENDFKLMPFRSEVDENWNGHEIVFDAKFRDDFIAEQVGQFTRHLLSVIHEVETRKDKYPFSKISKMYPRKTFQYYGVSVVCPYCGLPNGEVDWNEEYEVIRPYCLRCNGEFRMEEEE